MVRVWTSHGNHHIPNRMKRQMRGGGIMIWGAVTLNGWYKLIWIKGRATAKSYLKMLQDDDVLPWMSNLYPSGNYYFLQDNATIHKAKQVTSWFDSVGLQVLDWPARSPDLNPIENYWKMLSNRVYERGAFQTDADLWEAIQEAAQYIQQHQKQQVRNLIEDMNSRLLKVIDVDGKTIDQ